MQWESSGALCRDPVFRLWYLLAWVCYAVCRSEAGCFSLTGGLCFFVVASLRNLLIVNFLSCSFAVMPCDKQVIMAGRDMGNDGAGGCRPTRKISFGLLLTRAYSQEWCRLFNVGQLARMKPPVSVSLHTDCCWVEKWWKKTWSSNLFLPFSCFWSHEFKLNFFV